MTPTSGGSATGRARSSPRTRRPGNSARAKRKPSGTPTSPASPTDASEIHRLRKSAVHSSGRFTNSAKGALAPAPAPAARRPRGRTPRTSSPRADSPPARRAGGRRPPRSTIAARRHSRRRPLGTTRKETASDGVGAQTQPDRRAPAAGISPATITSISIARTQPHRQVAHRPTEASGKKSSSKGGCPAQRCRRSPASPDAATDLLLSLYRNRATPATTSPPARAPGRSTVVGESRPRLRAPTSSTVTGSSEARPMKPATKRVAGAR